MALTKKITINVFGKDIELPNAYIKVSHVIGDKNNLTASVDTYTEQGGQFVSRKDCVFEHNMNGGNAISQSYAHIKTLPEFSDAKDC